MIDIGAGENVFQQEEPILHYHVLRQGIAKLGRRKGSVEKLFALKVPGEVLECELRKEVDSRKGFCQTVTDVKVVVVEREKFFQAIETNGSVSQKIFYQLEREMCFHRRLKKIEREGEIGASMAFLLHHLLKKVKANREKIEPRHLDRLPLKQRELANLMGVSRGTVSKYIGRLKGKGAVETGRGGVKILAEDVLKEEFRDFI